MDAELAADIGAALEEFRFDVAADRLYHAFWHEYADWYIELVKPHLQTEGKERDAAIAVLLEVHDRFLRLLHPFIPFVTEEIWQALPQRAEDGRAADPSRQTITLARFPGRVGQWQDADAVDVVTLMQEVITAIRTVRSEWGVPPSRKVAAVVEGASTVTVILEGEEIPAEVHGRDAATDLALLKVELDRSLPYLTLGDSERLRVGDWVMAVGSPLTLSQSITVGIVSAKGRSRLGISDRSFENFIQTDAAINRGNSGGPLLNSRGQIIGITTAILSPSGTSAGIAFAVPIDVVASIVNDYIQHGKIRRPGLGVMIFEDRVTRMWGFRQGVWLRQVNEGTAAAAAGLRGTEVLRDRQVRREGDLILGIGGQETRNSVGLLDALDRFEVGDEVEVLYYRNGKREKTKLKLQQIEVD